MVREETKVMEVIYMLYGILIVAGLVCFPLRWINDRRISSQITELRSELRQATQSLATEVKSLLATEEKLVNALWYRRGR